MGSAKVFTVKEINNYVKSILDHDVILSNLYIKGEISNYKLHSSGHAYFTLKDNDSKMKCVMFKGSASKLKFMPEDGMAVVIQGHLSVFERDGNYQLYATGMIPEGIGALYKAYEQLKIKLEGLGYFDEANKKSLPFLPKTVGVITSGTGAAVRDIISIIRRRNNMVNIILYPVLVQGEGAAKDIARGIQYFNLKKNVDVIIAGRGGGSIEELWAFNEEETAHAIYQSEIPIVSAVGHETDYTIADFVADLRAATPSAAAELVVPDRHALLSRLNQSKYLLNDYMNKFLQEKRIKIEYISKGNAFRQIEQRIHDLMQTVDMCNKSMNYSMQQILNNNKNKLIHNLEKLDILNPASVLLRGYSYTSINGKIVTSIKQLEIGDNLEVQLKDGSATAEIKAIINK
ncbi:MAG: exodeoxyribonuclease large subunit [Clostridia bacterium]|jgi:exodeoxyribonuclease VII large subunit|nr:exodeoxyribonuclease large subunit [Clostridia bacterium]